MPTPLKFRGKIIMRTLSRLLLVGLFVSLAGTAMADVAPSGEPDVTIRQDGDRTIQEYRVNGFLYAIKVIPKGGKPYFLVRADGSDGNFVRSDQPDMLIPAWEIFSW
ncbi:Protein of unknown function [Pseudomonas cuatrocienegasensis]|uniref:DUF2782 domain-containing protein n=2 Tax=Pseudomonas TaxID=286 RepID=A0ABY1BH97_9PSED|nr:Protein of unknown function [Pseudomonas cuatrocienegasensis]